MGKNNKQSKPVVDTPVEPEVVEEVVEEVEVVTEEVTSKPVIGVVSNCDRLNVREKPFKGANVLTILA